MRSSALATLLFGSGIPADGYEFDIVSLTKRQHMCDDIVASPDADISEAPSLTFVELEPQKTIWLLTREGHFAHPSMLKRSLSENGETRTVQVSGFTAASPDVMRVWMRQFQAQDAQMSRLR